MGKKPAPGRTRFNDPEAMRRRVLDAAAEAFQSRGYHSTSTHDIMRAAGVTGGALHHHFRSKKELAVAVIRERVARAVEQTWIEPVQSARTATEGILRVFEQISKGLDERDVVLGCPLGNLALELSLAELGFSACDSGYLRALAKGDRAEVTSRSRDGDPAGIGSRRVCYFRGGFILGRHSAFQGGTSHRSLEDLRT